MRKVGFWGRRILYPDANELTRVDWGVGTMTEVEGDPQVISIVQAA